MQYLFHNNDKANKYAIGIYKPVDNFGFYAIFSNNAWETCVVVIWVPHDNSLTYSLLQVATLEELTTDVTNSCTLDTNRTQYFVISCSNTGVANKLASIQIKAV